MLTMQPVEASGSLFSRRVSRNQCQQLPLPQHVNALKYSTAVLTLLMGIGADGVGAAGKAVN